MSGCQPRLIVRMSTKTIFIQGTCAVLLGFIEVTFTSSQTLSLNQKQDTSNHQRKATSSVSDPNPTDSIQAVWVPLQACYLQVCYPILFIQSTSSSMLGITPTFLLCKEHIHYSFMQSFFIIYNFTPSDM